ncbi:uncharacterized protein LOC130136968 [Syzygium oleosum]|uniref:uncharacterized protein LOC130136968 n=1 Tax=Syzygium oleosum TaxID=219896 RepID=UPI0024BB620A|nr:uncharacterized protein LOC130136968 [Syzygium oleosum]
MYLHIYVVKEGEKPKGKGQKSGVLFFLSKGNGRSLAAHRRQLPRHSSPRPVAEHCRAQSFPAGLRNSPAWPSPCCTTSVPSLLLVIVLAAASTTALAQQTARSSEFQTFSTRTKAVKAPDQQASSVLCTRLDDPVAPVALEDTSSRFGVSQSLGEFPRRFQVAVTLFAASFQQPRICLSPVTDRNTPPASPSHIVTALCCTVTEYTTVIGFKVNSRRLSIQCYVLNTLGTLAKISKKSTPLPTHRATLSPFPESYLATSGVFPHLWVAERPHRRSLFVRCLPPRAPAVRNNPIRIHFDIITI